MIGTTDQLLNFFARIAFFVAFGSPLMICSAPTFFPLLGHPDLRWNRFRIMPQDESVKHTSSKIQQIFLGRMKFICCLFLPETNRRI